MKSKLNILRIVALITILVGLVTDTFAFAAAGLGIFALLFLIKRKALLVIIGIIGVTTLVLAFLNGKFSYYLYGSILTAFPIVCLLLQKNNAWE